MARPAGHPLNRAAWEDVLRLAGLSLTQVAEMSEVPRATLSGLLGGHHKASVPMAHRIAGCIPVQPATLFPSLAAVEVEPEAVPA
ncbi:helix-turn-helix domain-containing protein [Aquihabitans sp. G128]|uniref:helix-turn-helix domain-containing protein n=1 Tax=Aquihabitans sp. G128 TaxID=2849779 RepID=UPI001C21231E|nr:helix-turn-helix transcriptional regulator [Aquihabitans sp. G128]QXC59362.1 helix-turn-helix domain-containing protein [Aquihabitans sp. G128]